MSVRFGVRVRELRLDRGLTMRVAAQRADTSPQYWSDVERGQRLDVRLSTAYAFARALELDVTELLEGVKDPRADA